MTNSCTTQPQDMKCCSCHFPPAFLDKGGGVAQLVERRTRYPMTRGSNPSGAQEKIVSFSEEKMLCWLVVVVPNPPVCIRTHKNYHVRTLKIHVQSLVDYGNTKRPSMHLSDRVALLLRLLQPYRVKASRISRLG